MNSAQLSAFLLGQQLRRNLMAVREPTMYSYNGVVLPKLPEWDKSKYPYAVIWRSGTTNNPYYCAVPFEDYSFQKSGGGVWIVWHVPSDSQVPWYKATLESKAFEYYYDEYGYAVVSAIVWANFDVLNADGTLFLAKSDPVPIYE